MGRRRLDPDYPDAVVLGTKLGVTDATRVVELARRDRLSKSEWLRGLVLDALEREQGQPSDN